MRKIGALLSIGLIAALLITGFVMAGKRVAKARVNDGVVKGSVVMATIPTGWRVMAYIRGLTSPADAFVCLEPTAVAGEDNCTVPVCGVDEACGVDEYGNLDQLSYLDGGDFMLWPEGGGANFIADLDDGEVSAVVYHDVEDGVSAAAFVVVFP